MKSASPALSAVQTVAAMRAEIQAALGQLAKAARMKNIQAVEREAIEARLYAAVALADSIDRRMREARQIACATMSDEAFDAPEIPIDSPHDPHLGGSCTNSEE